MVITGYRPPRKGLVTEEGRPMRNRLRQLATDPAMASVALGLAALVGLYKFIW